MNVESNHPDDHNGSSPRHAHMRDVRGSHPMGAIEHGHNDVVCGKNCTEWIKSWMTWMLTQPSERSPFLLQYNPSAFDVDESQEESEKDEEGNSVWFLAGPPYGSREAGTFSKWVVLPPDRKWHILASPFTSYISKEEYPSLSADELYSQAKRDVDSVYKLEATLDGLNLAGCRVPIDKPFTIENIPQKNVLALSPRELKECKSTVNMCSDGYVFWLRPLSPGLHLLHLLAYSPIYEFDVKFQLNVR